MPSATQTSIPSHQRVEPGSVNIPIADLSNIKAEDPPHYHVDAATEVWVAAFNEAIQSPNLTGLPDLFITDSYWRDHFCLSWDVHTFKGPEKMLEFLKDGCRLKKVSIDRSSDVRRPTINKAFDGQGRIQGIQTFLITESDVGTGLGFARLVQQDGKLKAFTLFTSMRDLKGHEEATFGRRPAGVVHGGQPGRKNWQERRTADKDFENADTTVLIVGKYLI